MKRKVLEKYLYNGLGFPVYLLNVPMIKFDDTWAPDINHELLEKYVLLVLCQQLSPLTGDEVKFIRSWFAMTLQQFGDKFGVTPAGVKKWEDAEDQFTHMNEATEKLIRLYVLDCLFPQKITKEKIIRFLKKQ